MGRKRFFTFVMSQVRLRREIRRGRRLGLFGAACITALFATGCGGFRVEISTPEGIRAHHEGQNGLITNGKATADKDTAYWITHRANERERTQRNPWGKFTEMLRGNNKGQQTQGGE